MKKIVTLLLSVLMLVGLLSGCVQNDLGVKINSDGTGSVALTLGLDKEFYDQLKSTGSDPFDGKTTTTYTDGDDTYVAYTETTEYSSYEDIEKALLEMEYEYDMLEDAAPDDEESSEPDPSKYTLMQPTENETDKHIFKSVNIEKNSGIFYNTYTFKAVMNPQPKDNGSGYAPNDIYKVTVSVEMPSDITQAKDGKVEGNKVVFEIEDITEANELAATAESNNIGVVIGIIAVLVIIFAVVVFLVKRQK
ncbi:MAG TPA: hypothetical protein PLT66_06770 [Bacillota bacterium]|nr:hypothetical protein [Bacillota bacterium]